MPQPLLSIVTPSLNQGRYLGQCLESVAREMSTPLALEHGVEHIVMDGGSSDETVVLLESATHLTHWQSAPDGGQSAAINHGLLDHAQGRYATWLNADDWYEPGALAPILRRLADDNAPDVLVGRCRFVEGERTIFRPRPPEPLDMASLLSPRTKWFAGELIVQPEAFFSRDLFERVGGLNEANHYTMDHELWLRYLEAGARCESLDHPVACLRVHEGQKTADNRRIVESFIRFGLPFLERVDANRGPGGARAKAEMEAMARKLALSEPVRRRLHAPWKDVRSELVGTAPRAPGPDSFHLVPLRVVLAGVRSRPGLLRSRYTARVLGDAPLDALPLRLRPSGQGPFDVVLLWHALSNASDPLATLGRALDGLRPGGLVIVAAEIAPCLDAMRAYCDTLERRIDEQLSQNHDWLIDPGAMAWVESLRDATPHDDARFLAQYPQLFGVDATALMRQAGMDAVAFGQYGGHSWHPLTPIETPSDVSNMVQDTWCCGVWRRPSC